MGHIQRVLNYFFVKVEWIVDGDRAIAAMTLLLTRSSYVNHLASTCLGLSVHTHSVLPSRSKVDCWIHSRMVTSGTRKLFNLFKHLHSITHVLISNVFWSDTERRSTTLVRIKTAFFFLDAIKFYPRHSTCTCRSPRKVVGLGFFTKLILFFFVSIFFSFLLYLFLFAFFNLTLTVLEESTFGQGMTGREIIRGCSRAWTTSSVAWIAIRVKSRKVEPALWQDLMSLFSFTVIEHGLSKLFLLE